MHFPVQNRVMLLFTAWGKQIFDLKPTDQNREEIFLQTKSTYSRSSTQQGLAMELWFTASQKVTCHVSIRNEVINLPGRRFLTWTQCCFPVEEVQSLSVTESHIREPVWGTTITKGKNTGTRLFTEVKPCWMGLISGWVTISIKYPVLYSLGSQAGVVDISHAFHLYDNVVCGLSFSRSQPDFEGFLRALRFPHSAKLTPSLIQYAGPHW